MTDELDKRLLHELPPLGVGRNHIDGAVDGEHGAQLHHLHQLAHHVLAPEAGQTLVPDGSQ